MYIITSKNLKTIIGIGENVDYLSNGYPRITEQNVAFPTEMVDVYEVSYMPEYVTENKYCYTPDQGFYENPNWSEPNKFGLTDEQLAELEQDYRNKLAMEVNGNA